MVEIGPMQLLARILRKAAVILVTDNRSHNKGLINFDAFALAGSPGEIQ